jgi:hypothetical protein
MVAATALSVAALSAAVSTPVSAQVQQIPQGRALDANPQVGSGGSNQPVPGYVPINGNAIIEGNVAGLARFHGTVGTSSPYTFQERLPTSTLEGFTRTSAAGIPTGPTGSPPPIYYLPSQVVSGAGGKLYPTQIGSGFDVQIVPGPSIQPGFGPTSTAAVGGQNRIYDRNATPPPNDTNTSGNLLNSSLFIRQEGQADMNGPNVEANNPNHPNNADNLNNPQPGQTNNPKKNANPTDTDNQDNTKPEDTTAAGRARNDGRRPGERIDASAGAPRPGAEERANAMDIRKTGRMRDVGQQAMVSDTYRTLLGELDKAREEAKRTAASGAETPKPEENREAGLARAQGGNPALARRNTRTNPLLTESPETLRAGQKVEPLRTLAKTPEGLPVTPFDTQMQQAEKLLKGGKYMEAVDQYNQALTVQPNNALGMVGRAHAELAAGMYQSASMDLKAVFSQKPEMVSVRYALDDFIPGKRVENLMNDLLQLTTRQQTGNMASFLYCYLAYNTDHPTELQQELDRWGIRPTHDEWQTIAAKAWGK